MQRIGFIGLGIMGKPMATNLLKAGYDLKVFNRSPIPVEELRKKGCNVASSVSELAMSCIFTGFKENN